MQFLLMLKIQGLIFKVAYKDELSNDSTVLSPEFNRFFDAYERFVVSEIGSAFNESFVVVRDSKKR